MGELVATGRMGKAYAIPASEGRKQVRSARVGPAAWRGANAADNASGIPKLPGRLQARPAGIRPKGGSAALEGGSCTSADVPQRATFKAFDLIAESLTAR